MKAGELAYVLYAKDGAFNNLRDNPGLAANAIGAIAVGTVVELLEGPKVLDGMNWWRVFCARAWSTQAQRWMAMEGWTAQGKGDAVFLDSVEPVSICSSTNKTRLQLGQRAYVRRGVTTLKLRTAPKLDPANIAGSPAELSVVRLVRGPVCAENVVWWQAVPEAATLTGGHKIAGAYWIGEKQGGDYYLAPLEVQPQA